MDGEEKIGRYFPKQIEQAEIACKDEILKKQIEKISTLMSAKVLSKENDWTMEDYKAFRKELNKLNISVFLKIFPMMVPFFDLSREELKKYLKSLDQKLELHIFDSERVVTHQQNTVWMDGKEIKQTETIYSYQEHKFTMEDFIKFFVALYSKIKNYGGNGWKCYLSDDFETKAPKEKKEELLTILELLKQDQTKYISFIISNYQEWISQVKEEFIYPYMDAFSDKMLEWTYESIWYQLNINQQSVEKDFMQYRTQRYMENKSKEAISKTKNRIYKFG